MALQRYAGARIDNQTFGLNAVELDSLVKRVEGLIGGKTGGVTPEELKVSPRIRGELKDGLEEVLIDASKLVEEAPRRKFRLK